MAGLVNQFKVNPFIRNLAGQIAQTVAAKDWEAEMGAYLDWVRANVRYTLDINGVEVLQWPTATIQMGRGDCDDMCILLATLLESGGLPARFVAIGFEPQCFEHVYVEAQDPDTQEWIALDATEPNPVGWFADGYVCRINYRVPV